MEKICSVLEIWDTGATSSKEEREAASDRMQWWDDFYARTGARKIVGTRWTYKGITYEDKNRPVPVPDMSGLVYAAPDLKSWTVLNPDGTRRFCIAVPKLSENSVPQNGELGIPKHMKGDPTNVMYGEGSDGDRCDCRFIFDMNNGELVKVEFLGKHW
ncbi:hypothetical protein [Cupriavidus sp. 2SB]|uniref:hypothetical protein n=1 Tax=Cupriavidus sp. 2SB TaxID=2502199 RepID=UPI0010F696EC|nr:hypothetical protein [Cupriavidus sp. 2SB]